jgi:hypothetical protein
MLCALWIGAIAEADTSPTNTEETTSNDDARCACAQSCSTQQECQEADCNCAQKEVLPTDPNPLKFDDRIENWTYQEPK